MNLENVGKAFGTTVVLDGVSLGIAAGDRIGVVGRNGGGKSTLLKLITGEESPDTGRVTRTGGVSMARVTQRGHLPAEATIRAVVVGDGAEHEWAGDAAVREVLTGLGLATVGLDAGVARLSGGERRRVALGAALVQQADLLVLDEPTNHLVVEGITWLADYLVARRGALLVVTHDRWFLDAVCARTWEVGDASVRQFDGGYAAYVLARAERARVAAVTEERRQNLLRKELAWLRRGPPARTSKPRFRMDAAADLIADEPEPRDGLALQKMATARLGKDVVDLEDVTLAVGSGEDRLELLHDVTWRIGPGDRIGIVGVNGSGKTSLLRLMLGDLEPAAGRVKRGTTVRPALLSQDLAELDDVVDLRVQEAVATVRGVVRIGDRDVTAGQLLERLGFTRERVWTPVAELSGGERRRLQLLRLLMGEPNLLVLDEPTNDLDTDTLAAVEDTLDGWPGTLLVVSHDRYLLERVCDRQVAMLGDGRIRDLPGGVEEYLELRRQALAAPTATPAAAAAPATGAATVSAVSARSAGSAGDARTARKDMARVERRLSRLSDAEEKLHAELAANATDHEAVLRLDERLRALHAEREALEEEWLAAAEITG